MASDSDLFVVVLTFLIKNYLFKCAKLFLKSSEQNEPFQFFNTVLNKKNENEVGEYYIYFGVNVLSAW